MILFPREHRTSRDRTRLQPVTTVPEGPDMRIEGRRLGTLGMGWLQLHCECGHEGEIAVPDLAGRYGREARVCEAIAQVRCSQCGRKRIRRISISD